MQRSSGTWEKSSSSLSKVETTTKNMKDNITADKGGIQMHQKTELHNNSITRDRRLDVPLERDVAQVSNSKVGRTLNLDREVSSKQESEQNRDSEGRVHYLNENRPSISSYSSLILSCPNCKRENSKENLFSLSNCKHRICKDCLGKYLRIWLKMAEEVQVISYWLCLFTDFLYWKCPIGRRKIGNIRCDSYVRSEDVSEILGCRCKQCPNCNIWCLQDRRGSSLLVSLILTSCSSNSPKSYEL